MGIVEIMKTNAAIRLSVYCLHCKVFNPMQECIAMNDIDERSECKMFLVVNQ